AIPAGTGEKGGRGGARRDRGEGLRGLGSAVDARSHVRGRHAAAGHGLTPFARKDDLAEPLRLLWPRPCLSTFRPVFVHALRNGLSSRRGALSRAVRGGRE